MIQKRDACTDLYKLPFRVVSSEPGECMFNELDDFLMHAQSDEEDLSEDLEPLEEEEDDPDVISGKICAVCGTAFTEEHGKLVVCKDCSGSKEGVNFPLATFPEEDA